MTDTLFHAQLTMTEVLALYPGARRALFKGFHIGGCKSCGYAEQDTLADVAQKHDKDVNAMVAFLHEAKRREALVIMSAADALAELKIGKARMIDLRPADEYAVEHIEGAEPISPAFAEEVMEWPKESRIILYCNNGVGSLNAAAYMSDYGFTSVSSVEGGYPALRDAK